MMTFNREQLHRLATDAGMDEANRRMRKAGRTAWDESDYAAACETFEKVYWKQQVVAANSP